jgi:hypothetical protein
MENHNDVTPIVGQYIDMTNEDEKSETSDATKSTNNFRVLTHNNETSSPG